LTITDIGCLQYWDWPLDRC